MTPHRLGKTLVERMLGLGLALGLATATIMAQTGANTGLKGRVLDPMGASIPGAAVTLVRVETGERRVVTTSEEGNWEARFLAPGNYQLIFEQTGFKKLVRDGLSVSTAEIATSTSSCKWVTWDRASRWCPTPRWFPPARPPWFARWIEWNWSRSRPLRETSRSFLVIEPGVSADISELLSNDNASISPSVNGARTTNNSFVFNGVDVTNLLCCNSRINGAKGTIDEGGGSLSRNVAPALETLEEVKLQTSLYDAATGRNGGGNFQLVSKSGTNEFHGSVYHFFSERRADRQRFLLQSRGPGAADSAAQRGRLYRGRAVISNRTFFFGSYQLTRARPHSWTKPPTRGACLAL